MRAAVILPCLVAAACGRLGFDASAANDAEVSSTRDGAADGTPSFTANLVFITSQTVVPGTLAAAGGGDPFAAADQRCMEAAVAAQLPGTYRAYLSTTSTAAPTRLGSARGWVRRDGLVVVDTVADLIPGRLFHPVVYDELGVSVPDNEYVATGTTAAGVAQSTCADWTSSAVSVGGGSPVGTNGAHTQWSAAPCTAPRRLLCFGVDRTEPVVPAVTVGRVGFVATSWMPGGGLASADARCASDAASAGLPGTFRALLATAGATAASRFDTSGPLWVRRDGMRLASSNDRFMAGDLETTPMMNAMGQHLTGASAGTTFFGAADALTPGTTETTCGDWLLTTSPTLAIAGRPMLASVDMYSQLAISCGSPSALYCLEQ